MRNIRIFSFGLAFIAFLFSLNAFAVDHMPLPEGAKLRIGQGVVKKLAYSPDETRIAVQTNIGTWLYDTTTGLEVGNFIAHVPSHYFWDQPLVYSPDDNMLVVGGMGDQPVLWDVRTGEMMMLHRRIAYDHVTNPVVFSRDGRKVASVGTYPIDAGTRTRILISIFDIDTQDRFDFKTLTPNSQEVLMR